MNKRLPWHITIPDFQQRLTVLEELTYYWLTQWAEHPETAFKLV